MFSIDQTSENPDHQDELLVSIPRPRRRKIKSIRIFGLGLIITLFLVYYLVKNLIQRDDLTGIQIALHVLFITLAIFTIPLRSFFIWLSLKPALEIFRSGIAMHGMKTSWEHVEECGWAKYSPDNLMVRSYHQQSLIPIPPQQRAAVESALRNAGKWQS